MIYDVAAAFVFTGAIILFFAALSLIADLIDWHEDTKARQQDREVRRHFYKTMQALDMYETEMPSE